MPITDYSDEIAKYNPEKKVKKNGKYAPQHNFLGIMCGPTGCGKTNTLIEMIVGNNPDTRIYFDKIYIFAKDIGEEAYVFLKAKFEEAENYVLDNYDVPKDWSLYQMSDKLSDVPMPDKLDKKLTNMMIFDDWIGDKGQDIIDQHYKFGRKHNCSYFYLGQNYFKIPQFIRQQANILLTWRLHQARDSNRLLSEQDMGLGKEVMHEMYMAATIPYSFLMIDKKTKDDSLKIRKCFDELPKYN